ncbi:MAG: DEAD/DEAH box helicase [Pseudomonadota bacterium]
MPDGITMPGFVAGARAPANPGPVSTHAFPTRKDERLNKIDQAVQLALGQIKGRTTLAQRIRVARRARAVFAFEAEFEQAEEAQLKQRLDEVRARLVRGGLNGAAMCEAVALVREGIRRSLGMRPHDVQVRAALILLDCALAEMATGEGKSLVAVLAAATAGLARIPAHVVTVNDYLAERDLQEMQPLFDWLGLRVGCILHEATPDERREIYARDVVYASNKEISFDYLRDTLRMSGGEGNLRLKLRRLENDMDRRPVMRGLHFAIVDEADSVLVDDARTPLILSRETDVAEEASWAETAHGLAMRLREGAHYDIRHERRLIELTDLGKDRLSDVAAGLGPLWQNRVQREQAVCQALSARLFFQRGDQYVVQDGKVVIVDEYTGRLMPERSWNDGLHQLVEHKEGVDITPRKLAIARTTYQRFFRRYLKLAGMSGTARELRAEIAAVYRMPTLPLATRLPVARRDLGTRIHVDRAQKWNAVIDSVQRLREANRPVLIGTRTVAASEELHAALDAAQIPHCVLNALNHEEEGALVAEAGVPGRVTVATNMAGRGVHIGLDEAVVSAGGLHVILTERHDSARIDRQLIGRTARQGQPGSYEAILGLDDFLLNNLRAPILRWLAQRRGSVGRGAGQLLFRKGQRRAERANAQARRALFTHDQRLQGWLAFSGVEE